MLFMDFKPDNVTLVPDPLVLGVQKVPVHAAVIEVIHVTFTMTPGTISRYIFLISDKVFY